MICVVTGSSGRLGSSLVDRYLSEKTFARVIGIDLVEGANTTFVLKSFEDLDKV